MRATYPREGFIELQERYRKRASKRKAERFERGRGFESPRLQRLTLKLLESVNYGSVFRGWLVCGT